MDNSKKITIGDTFIINDGKKSHKIKGKIDFTNKEVNIKGQIIKNTYKEANKNMIIKTINECNKKYIKLMKKLAKY